MKRFFAVLLILAFLAPVAFAADITPTGMSQKDLVALLQAMVTDIKTIKARLNTVAASDNTAQLAIATDNIVLSPRSGF
jgi:hypothetical protein